MVFSLLYPQHAFCHAATIFKYGLISSVSQTFLFHRPIFYSRHIIVVPQA